MRDYTYIYKYINTQIHKRIDHDVKRNIYKDLLTPEEAEAAMEDYILFKQIEKAERESVCPFD